MALVRRLIVSFIASSQLPVVCCLTVSYGGLLCISFTTVWNVYLTVGQGNSWQGSDQDYGLPLRGWHAEN